MTFWIFVVFGFDSRRDPRFNPWGDRPQLSDSAGRDHGVPTSGSGDVSAPYNRARGEDWKDPWLRSVCDFLLLSWVNPYAVISPTRIGRLLLEFSMSEAATLATNQAK